MSSVKVGDRVTLNGKRNHRLNGRKATVTEIFKQGRKTYVRVGNIEGLHPGSGRIYDINQVN